MPNQYSDPEPYHDRDTLKQLYCDEELTTMEIAERFDVSQSVITRWLDKNDINTRTSAESRDLNGTNHSPTKDGPHTDPEWLREKYFDEGLTLEEMAEEAGLESGVTILINMDKHGMERRTVGDYLRKEDSIRTAKHDNHEQISFTGCNGSTRYYDVHRLLAIAIWGLDEVAGKIVHHSNGIGWDNRPDNLELIESQAEHAKMHNEERDRDEHGRFV